MKLCFYFKGKAKNLPEILRLPETIRMFENAKSTYLASLERFNRAETEEEIDAAIYDLNAALIRYNSIIKQTKEDYLGGVLNGN